MSGQRKVSDQQCSDAYRKHGALTSAAEALGIARTSLHERLTKLGAITHTRTFSERDRARLTAEYRIFRDSGRLRDLAEDMGRTVPFLSRQARTLGLTDRAAPKPTVRVWKGMPEITAGVIWDDFKSSSLGLGAYCRSKGYDDLGFARTMRQHFGDEWEHVIEAKAPRQGMYRLGRAFEYAIRDRLKVAGYYVLRSPASKSPTDLVAIAPGVVLFVQCKRGGALAPAEWNELFALAGSVGALPIMAQRVGARDVAYWLIEARKDGSRRRQPMRAFEPRSVLEEAA